LPELQAQIRHAAGRPIVVPTYRLDRIRIRLEAGNGQGPAIAVTTLEGTQQLTTYTSSPPKVARRDRPKAFRQTLELQEGNGRWLVARVRKPAVATVKASPATQRAAEPA
jgi:hypothetical protein